MAGGSSVSLTGTGTLGTNYKAVVRDFTTTPNASKQIVVALTTVTDNASIAGIEILR